MTKASVARVLLGLVFFVFGLNGFLHFLPQPPISGPPAMLFGAFVATGYMIPLIKGTEVAASVLLLSNRYVPLALTVLAPVIVNILAFHAFLAPGGLGVPLVVVALELFLAYSYRSAFRSVLDAHAVPEGAAPYRKSSSPTPNENPLASAETPIARSRPARNTVA
jgi:hypothetical protein